MHRSSVLTRRLAAALALLALVISVAAPATLGAAKKKSHKVNVTVTAAVVQSGGGTSTIAGVAKGTPIKGQAATLYTLSGTGATQTAAFTVFDKRGSMSGTSTATVTPAPNNTATVNGTGKITSGTGAYKGARGTLNVTGTVTSTTIQLTSTGTVKY
jgi:hypothetical protein